MTKTVEAKKLSPFNEDGSPKWFSILYPFEMPDGTIHMVTLEGRMKRDEAGKWEIDQVRGSSQAGSRVSDMLRSIHEGRRFHDFITKELEKDYSI